MRAGSRYDRMIGSLQTMQSVLNIAGEDNVAYMLPAYARAIGDMKKYRKELNGIKDKNERRRQKDVIDAVLK
ncbi:MAG: hypothetical protein IJU66_08525 [Oscillospiraceae bacterium]|nr:hypothetical protein [Oscillospiraceae bacterium]